ncbi:hypothetical protein SNEBB_004704 [Seison nebaliae]|nr:hypothetical protein SNEBB_004704 [Seison nebaliae]
MDLPWMKERCIEIIKNYSYPNVVIIPENRDFRKIGPVQLSIDAHRKLARTIIAVVNFVNQVPFLTMNDLRDKFPTLSPKELLFSPYRPTLNPQYWNGNEFKTQKLFKNFLPNHNDKNYLLIGITLAIEAEDLVGIRQVYKFPKLSAEIIERNKHTIMDILKTYRQLQDNPIMTKQSMQIAVELVSSAVFYETLVNLNYYKEQKSNRLRTQYEKFVDIRYRKSLTGHIVAFVKSFSDKWYFVNNDLVLKVINIQVALVRYHSAYSYVFDMVWHEESSYNRRNYLKQHMKPILMSHYRDRR